MALNAQAAYPSLHAVHLKNKIGSLLDRVLQPTLANKACYRVFRSNEGISNECSRQKKFNRFIIHPFSPFRWYWDMVMVATLLFTLITLPVEIAFYTMTDDVEEKRDGWSAIYVVADIIFLLDIILNFRTGYVHSATEEVILDNGRIVKHYLTTWFIIDLVSSVPFDNVYELFSAGKGGASVYITLKVLRLTKLLSLLRIFRVARLLRYIHKLEELLEVENKVISMFNLIMIIVMFCHWNGCVQFLAAAIEHYPDYPEKSWVVYDDLHLNTTTAWTKYTKSLFRALSHMLSIGYGSHPPVFVSETWCVILSMTLGATFYALFIGHMSGLIMTMDSSGKKYEEKVSEVKQYMKFRRVPVMLQQKVLDYYDHKYQRKYFNENEIIFEPYMSTPIKQDIQMHNCRLLVEKVPFLSSAPLEFLYEIICKLNFQVFFPGDVILQAGKKGDCMYFIEHGRVDIQLPTGQTVNSLSDGAYFGEISLLLEERRVASVVAVETCDVYVLKKANFKDVLDDYPSMKKVLEEIAKQRLEDLRREEVNMQPSFDSADDPITVQAPNPFSSEIQKSPEVPDPHSSTTLEESHLKDNMTVVDIR